MAFSGVLSSWLMRVRKSVFMRLTRSTSQFLGISVMGSAPDVFKGQYGSNAIYQADITPVINGSGILQMPALRNSK